MATYTSNYAWTKPSGSDNVDISVLNNNLDDQDTTIHDAFLNMAPPFSESSTYAVDDIVLYGTGLYKCHTAVVTPGSWTGSTNWQVYKLSEGGGGTYADLPDKPSINGNELSGNKTGAQLGLQNTLTFDNVPTANSTNPVKSGGVYAADEAIRQWTTAEAKSVNGNPITLTDGSARNAEGLGVTCNPKQNLHGYDHPWAAGAGKNKLPMTVANLKAINTSGTWLGNSYTVSGITYEVQTDTDDNVTGIKVTGTSTSVAYFSFGTYNTNGVSSILNGCPSGGAYEKYCLSIFGVGIDVGSGFTFNASADISIRIASGYTIPTGGVTFYPMIRLSTVSDATFAPYTNICPITGLTECVVDTVGSDLAPSIKSGVYSGNNGQYISEGYGMYVTTDKTEIVQGKTYTAKFGQTGSDMAILFWDSNNSFMQSENIRFANKSEKIFTAPTGAKYCIAETNDTSISTIGYITIGETHTATITFGQTVYGARINLKTGKARVTHKSVTVSSFLGKDGSAHNNFYFSTPDAKLPSANTDVVDVSSNIFTLGYSYEQMYRTDTGGVAITTSGLCVVSFGMDSAVNTLELANAWLAENSLQVVYELATPIEIQLTPAELTLLKGYNYITSNGTTIALDYLPNSLLAEAENYVDAKIPPAPSSDGTYVLTCTVTSGTPAYTWESAT